MSSDIPATTEPPKPANALPSRTPLPDIADIIFVLLIFLLLNLRPEFVLEDGSTGWHLATGKWIISHGAIPHQDFLSATFPGKEWVPYEWLSDVTAAALDAIGGIKLVAVATSCAIAWLFSLVYLECRRNGCHFVVALLLTIVASLGSSIHWLARPHIFTFFGVFLVTRHLEKFRRGEETTRRLLISIAVIMMLWSNFHPAFLVGFALIVIYMYSEWKSWLGSGGLYKAASLGRLKIFACALPVAFGATLINPNGTRMYSYIFNYLRQSYVLQNTQEYMPPNFKELHAICMLLIFFAWAVGLAGSRRSVGLAPFLAVMAFAYLGINSMRNEPLFVLVATPFAATLLAQFSLRKFFGRGYVLAPWLQERLAKFRPVAENIDEIERTCTMHILPIATTLLLCISCFSQGKIGPLELVPSDFDPMTKPTETLKCIDAMHLDYKHGLNYDNWGGYIYYKTQKPVFIDDRLDFYGSDYFVDYSKMLRQGADAKGVMDRRQVQWVIFPKKSEFIAQLKASPNWQVLCEDKAATVMIRKDAPTPAPSQPEPSSANAPSKP
jgi:hypothetical protein